MLLRLGDLSYKLICLSRSFTTQETRAIGGTPPVHSTLGCLLPVLPGIIIIIIMIMIIIIIVMIIIIAFKGGIRDFFTISSQRRELSSTRTLKWPGRNRVQITCNTSSAYHVQLSCYVPLGTTAQLLSLTELKSHLFELYFFG